MRQWVLIATLLSSCGELDVGSPPTDPVELHGWLKSGEYRDWAAESTAHPGLNGTRRRVFVNDLVNPNRSPVGAAAVRELWNADADTQLGWSVLVKTREGWWCYETFDLVNPERFAVAEINATGCVGCHAAAPDTIQSSFPLR